MTHRLPPRLAFTSPLPLSLQPVAACNRCATLATHFFTRSSVTTLLRHVPPTHHRRASNAPAVRCGASSPSPSANPAQEHQQPTAVRTSTSLLLRVTSVLTNLFPVWTAAASVIALRWPWAFASLASSPANIQLLLSVLMLSTGLTLSPADLMAATRKPRPVIFAFVACYVAMPLLALALAAAFRLEGTLRAGLLLLSIISGGQMSNLCTQVAGGDTALSVTMTTTTTVAAVVMLPLLSSMLLGTVVPVDTGKLAMSTARVTLLPIAAGAAVNRLWPRAVNRILPVLPLVGIAAVVAIVLGPVATSAGLFATAWRPLLAPVLLLHCLGGIVGFAGPASVKASNSVAVATAFETAFKSPALSYLLARQFFPGGVELASTVSIVVLAPCAALCAVLLRVLARRKQASEANGCGHGSHGDDRSPSFDMTR